MKNLRGRSRAAATSKKDRFVIIINSWKPLTIIAKRSILDVAAALDPPLNLRYSFFCEIPMIVTTAEYINEINLFVVGSVFPKIDFEKLLEVGLRYFKIHDMIMYKRIWRTK